MRIKVHTTPEGKNIVAVCDSDIFGKCFEQGEFCLDLSSDFFDGEEESRDKISELVKKAYIVSLAGCEAVDLGKKLEIVKDVKKIGDVPFAQSVVMDK